MCISYTYSTGAWCLIKRTFDNEYLSSFCKELYLVIRSGISVSEGVSLVAEGEPDEEIRGVLNAVYQQLEEGSTVTDAFRSAKAFPHYMLQMVSIGESTGYLESVFNALSEYYERQVSISRSIRSAVVYPAILFVMMLAVIAVLVIEVLPIFNDVFAQLGSTMSPVALAFMRFGEGLRSARWVFLGIAVVIVVLLILFAFVPALNKKWSAFFSRLFSRTALGKKVSAARVAAAMSMTLSSGMDPDAALEMSQQLTEGSAAAAQIQNCRDRIAEGEGFAEAVGGAGIFAPVYSRMLSVGVRAGSLPTAMEEVARRSKEDVNLGIERTLGRVEPILVIVMSLLVGLVLLSVMLPLMGIMSSIG